MVMELKRIEMDQSLGTIILAWSTFNPGVELSPVNRVEIFCNYMDDFNPGVEMLYTFPALIPGSKKAAA
jgi:hypothetical protein